MSAVKEQIAEIVARQPDDSTFDEILREIAFARMIERGQEDIAAGRVVSDEEMQKVVAGISHAAIDRFPH